MIVDTIAGIVIGLVQAALDAVLPTDPSPAAGISVVGFFHLYSWIDTAFPLHEAIGNLITMVEVLGILGGIWVVVWILTKLHLLGGSS